MAINGPNGPIDPGSMNPETMQSLPPEAMSSCTAGDMQQMPPHHVWVGVIRAT